MASMISVVVLIVLIFYICVADFQVLFICCGSYLQKVKLF
jgi:hypothetical protein